MFISKCTDRFHWNFSKIWFHIDVFHENIHEKLLNASRNRLRSELMIQSVGITSVYTEIQCPFEISFQHIFFFCQTRHSQHSNTKLSQHQFLINQNSIQEFRPKNNTIFCFAIIFESFFIVQCSAQTISSSTIEWHRVSVCVQINSVPIKWNPKNPIIEFHSMSVTFVNFQKRRDKYKFYESDYYYYLERKSLCLTVHKWVNADVLLLCHLERKYCLKLDAQRLFVDFRLMPLPSPIHNWKSK